MTLCQFLDAYHPDCITSNGCEPDTITMGCTYSNVEDLTTYFQQGFFDCSSLSERNCEEFTECNWRSHGECVPIDTSTEDNIICEDIEIHFGASDQ